MRNIKEMNKALLEVESRHSTSPRWSTCAWSLLPLYSREV